MGARFWPLSTGKSDSGGSRPGPGVAVITGSGHPCGHVWTWCGTPGVGRHIISNAERGGSAGDPQSHRQAGWKSYCKWTLSCPGTWTPPWPGDLQGPSSVPGAHPPPREPRLGGPMSQLARDRGDSQTQAFLCKIQTSPWQTGKHGLFLPPLPKSSGLSAL